MAGNRDCRGRSCDNHPQTTFMTSFGCAVVYPRHNAPAFAFYRYWFHSRLQNFANRPHSFPTADDLEGNLGITLAHARLQIIVTFAYHDYEGTGRTPRNEHASSPISVIATSWSCATTGLLIVGTSVRRGLCRPPIARTGLPRCSSPSSNPGPLPPDTEEGRQRRLEPSHRPAVMKPAKFEWPALLRKLVPDRPVLQAVARGRSRRPFCAGRWARAASYRPE